LINRNRDKNLLYSKLATNGGAKKPSGKKDKQKIFFLIHV
jgi:hypothetical protein